MFAFLGRHKRLFLGLGAAGAGIATYYKTVHKQKLKKMAYCDSRYLSKLSDYNKVLVERYDGIPYFEEERKDEWEKSDEKEGCVVSKLTVPYSDFYVIRGKMQAKTSKSIKDIMSLVTSVAVNPSKRKMYKKLDPDNIYYNVLHCFEKPKKYLCHGRWTANSWVVCDRDFVVIRDTKVFGNDMGVMYGGSVNEEGVDPDFYPSDKDCVKGHINQFFWKVKRIDKDTVEVTYCTHADPKGSIPTFVYNMVATNQAFGCLRYVKNLVED